MEYIQFKKNGKHWYEHRYVWTQAHGEIPKGMVIHHINGNTKDNRLENLACVTQQENKAKALGKGYTKVKDNKNFPYRAIRRVNGTMESLGFYGTICGAYLASRMAYIVLKTIT